MKAVIDSFMDSSCLTSYSIFQSYTVPVCLVRLLFPPFVQRNLKLSRDLIRFDNEALLEFKATRCPKASSDHMGAFRPAVLAKEPPSYCANEWHLNKTNARKKKGNNISPLREHFKHRLLSHLRIKLVSVWRSISESHRLGCKETARKIRGRVKKKKLKEEWENERRKGQRTYQLWRWHCSEEISPMNPSLPNSSLSDGVTSANIITALVGNFIFCMHGWYKQHCLFLINGVVI